MADRGVSAVLGYVLTLGIVTLLVSGLFFAAGNFVEDQHERAVRSEFEVIGNRVAADIAAMDRLALASGAGGEAELRVSLPPRAAGKGYQLEVRPVTGTSTVYHLNLTATGLDVAVEVRVKAQTPLVNSTVEGGDILVAYNGTHLEVRDA